MFLSIVSILFISDVVISRPVIRTHVDPQTQNPYPQRAEFRENIWLSVIVLIFVIVNLMLTLFNVLFIVCIVLFQCHVCSCCIVFCLLCLSIYYFSLVLVCFLVLVVKVQFVHTSWICLGFPPVVKCIFQILFYGSR